MASQSVTFLTAAYNVVSREENTESATQFAALMADMLLENEEFLKYWKTPRGKGETLKLCEAWGVQRKEFADLAIALRLPPSPAAPANPPQTPKTQAPVTQVAGVLLPDGGLNLRGRNYSKRQLDFFAQVLGEWFNARKGAQI